MDINGRFAPHQLSRITAFLLGMCISPTIVAATLLNLSDNAVEVLAGVQPNIMILNDDSGSMSYEVITLDANNDGAFTGNQRTGPHSDGGSVAHRAGCTFDHNPQQVLDGYVYGVKFSNQFWPYTSLGEPATNCYVAADAEWRFRNHDFNPLYFDASRHYEPWAGLNSYGEPFGDIPITSAPNDPYYFKFSNPSQSASETINLTTQNSLRVADSTGQRYYTWNDADNDGRFDNGEQTQHLIKDADNAMKQNFANWFAYYRSRELTAKAALSHVIRDNTTARIGYATINNNNNARIRVAPMNVLSSDGNKKTLLDQLYATVPNNTTPLRISLDKVGRYFQCASDDIFGSTSSSSPGQSTCPVLAAPAGTCQSNHALLMTDGFYNDSFSNFGNKDGSSNTNYDGGAFGDSHSHTLADIAMDYYERDLHSSLGNDVPTNKLDIDSYPGSATLGGSSKLHQHMSTNTVGFGVNGALTTMPANPKVAANPAWPDPFQSDAAKIDDLRHAAYNGRGQFLSASDPATLSTALTDIFKNIGVGRSAASAVAFNTQNIESDSVVFRAFFETTTNTGAIVAQRIRSDGSIDPTIVWNAAEKLDAKASSNSDTRVIITSKDNATGGVPFQWNSLTTTQQSKLNNPVPGALPSSYGAVIGEERLAHLRGHTVNEGADYNIGQLRERPATKGKLGDIVHASPVFVGVPPFYGRLNGAWPGDYDTYPDDLYSKFRSDRAGRDAVVYVGANDGMVHGFKARTGEELFAYVPSMVFADAKNPNNPYLSELTKPNYSHRFYVDLPPIVNDVFMKKTGASSPSWNSVLIGGLGAGGKGYFALNITDPSTFNSETNAKANVMWEFKGSDDASGDLGYSFSEPLIAMSNADNTSGTAKTWVAIFGNGYNSTSTNGNAKLYVVFIEQGQDGWQTGDFIKIDTGVNGSTLPDTTQNGIGGVRGIDIDGNGTVDRVYAGDLQGNLYRFDVSSSNSGNWSSSTPTKIFQAAYTSGGTTIKQPITTRPIVIKHPTKDGYIIITATGRYFTNEDATSTNIQSIYGIWDDGGSSAVQQSQLVEQVLKNEISTEDGFTVRTLTNYSIAWKNSGGNQKRGWYIDFDVPKAGGSAVEFPGERAVRNLQLRGGLLFVNSVIPRSNSSCTGFGGFELGFSPATGGSGSKVIFDLDGDGKFDSSDNVQNTAGDAKIVVGVRLDTLPGDAAFIGNQRITQLSGDNQTGENGEDDNQHGMGTNTANQVDTGRQSWREVGF